MLVMVMVITQFFTQGAFPSPNIDLFYIGVLVIYSIHKELLRWLGEKEIERQGEYFVYSWIILTALFYLVNFLSKGYFNGAGESGQSDTLRDTSYLTLEVLAVFIFTRSLKLLRYFFKKG